MDFATLAELHEFHAELAAAGALLAKSRIAVYPVDVRGLQGRGVDITNSATEAETLYLLGKFAKLWRPAGHPGLQVQR